MKDALYQSIDGFDGDTGQAHAFIQWKGTDLCADFHCTCGEHHHIDATFVYEVVCSCGLKWEMPHTVALKPVQQTTCAHYCSDDDDGDRDDEVLAPPLAR